ncbi:cupin domain-containing protein [Burkholderia ubonensis]|uniref:cupin domain-containing protein n=1 Tax=Burkholderia ubonensis TaxID=101571 RepID=UPI0007565FEF|nr:cupin domain-containing protein [Burkholderia ubonensis]KVN48406.1 cupin [Burkholderia ubonensis]
MSCHPLVRARSTTALIAALALLAGAMHLPTAVAAEPQVEVTQLLKTTHSWDGVQYRAYPDGQPEVSVLRYKIPAHSALPWHTHPVINAAYVLSGHLTVIRKSDGKTMMIGPGDALPEMVGVPHRGQSGDEPVELIVFYAGSLGMPLVVKSEPD